MIKSFLNFKVSQIFIYMEYVFLLWYPSINFMVIYSEIPIQIANSNNNSIQVFKTF